MSKFIDNLKKLNILDYLLVFMLIATSGIMYFYSNVQYIIAGLFIGLVVFFNRRIPEKTDRLFILIFLLFISWEFMQNFYFQSYSLKQLFGTAIRFLFAYIVIKVAGKKFIDSYVNIIFVLSIISLVFYISYFFPAIRDILISNAIKEPLFPLENDTYKFTPNYILVNFGGWQETRNAGPFWEPGAFAAFLNIALVFNIIKRKRMFDAINIVFIAALITTLSTAGFITLFFVFSSAFLFTNPSIKKVLILIPMIGLFTVLIINMEFLLPKIKDNVIIAKNDNSSRFGSALSDYELIYKNPFIGYGRDYGNIYKTSTWDTKKMHRNNGITNFITRWGLIISFVFFGCYKLSANKIVSYYSANKLFSWVFLITMLLLGFSQGLFQYPFFYSLAFLQFGYKQTAEYKTENNVPDYPEKQQELSFTEV
ncbi:MAG: hypothetical protein EHM47_17110 [Ignavibacteriales bacterium]|nr:MAG: hypothetical protein EHM47_17110 [Ignavibacteriales bacterium]